jgi:DNA-directed RNA polymerase subunit N (RpoN/RPB10)
MIVPVRCFTCGMVLADKWLEYLRRANADPKNRGLILFELGINRMCCRTAMLTNVDMMDVL